MINIKLFSYFKSVTDDDTSNVDSDVEIHDNVEKHSQVLP